MHLPIEGILPSNYAFLVRSLREESACRSPGRSWSSDQFVRRSDSLFEISPGSHFPVVVLASKPEPSLLSELSFVSLLSDKSQPRWFLVTTLVFLSGSVGRPLFVKGCEKYFKLPLYGGVMGKLVV